mgnify:CR=1 FL=1
MKTEIFVEPEERRTIRLQISANRLKEPKKERRVCYFAIQRLQSKLAKTWMEKRNGISTM